MARSTTSKSASEKSTKSASKKAEPSANRESLVAEAARKVAASVAAGDAAPKSDKPTEKPEGNELKKPELIDAVVARSGIKKRDAKPAIEAVLEILGETLANEREFNLQPFAKMKINRTKDAGGAMVTIAKLRRPKAEG